MYLSIFSSIFSFQIGFVQKNTQHNRNGNYNNNLGTFSWQAYPDDGPIADYDNTENNIIPGECLRLQLSKKKIQEYQEATK